MFYFASVGQKRGFVAVMDLTKLVWCQAADKLGKAVECLVLHESQEDNV